MTQWTREPPKEPGWWWLKMPCDPILGEPRPEIVRVTKEHGMLWVVDGDGIAVLNVRSYADDCEWQPVAPPEE